MAEGSRPGGLTALAVLNFVFGGLWALFTLIGLAGLALLNSAGAKIDGEPVGSQTMAFVSLLLVALSAFLLITSGVGYIKMKRFMGRTMGTAYAILSLGSTLLNVLVLDESFGIAQIIFTIYPVLTLIMVNTTFSDDLVN
ncbi:MAG: hypothetical protein NT062_26730 [Proteobacteria bacterium]|nr:hypothetical protein [Pseudomonadota bacterium]